MFCSVRETRSHVIEMLRRYWLTVCVIFVDKTIVAATAKSSYPSSAMLLCFWYDKVGWFCMQLVYAFLVYMFLV